MRVIKTVFIVPALCLIVQYGYAASLYEKMQQGRDLFEQEKFDDALNSFVDAQIEHPEDPKLKFNIATAHYKMKNYEEAVNGFLDIVTTAQDARLEEKALYNIGNAMYRQGKLEEAVEYYKKALELDHEDKDAQHNLEFVREEIKRRLNEAKKTAQQQDQQQQQDRDRQAQQQDRGEQQQQQQQQQNEDTQQQQQQTAGQQDQQHGQQEQDQQTAAQDKQAEEKTDGSALQARDMTRDEAEQWLNSVQENREKFQAKQQKGRGRAGYGSGKDW